MKENLYEIEANVSGKEYSYVAFHFYDLEQTLDGLLANEVKTISFCRALLDEVYKLIGIIGKTRIADINKLVRPKIKYNETYDKTRRYFETIFTLGDIKMANAVFQMFGFNLILRTNESLHIIDYGRFDFEFQALQEHTQHVGVLEGIKTHEVRSYINDNLNEFVKPIKVMIEKTTGKQLAGIHLAAADYSKFTHLEGDAVLVSSGVVLGSVS